jgi:hypothetical protein
VSGSDDTVDTPYGQLDKAALLELENTYDTRVLLSAVEQLDQILLAARAQDGLRDTLLRLHGMAHTVVNGAGMVGSAQGESLPELAFDTTTELRELIATLQRWIKQIEPLEALQPRD